MADKHEESPAALYHSPAVHLPTVARLRSIAQKLGLDLSDEEIQTHQGFMKGWLESCNVIDRMPEPTLPVKYPRIPGYRPGPEENKHNAWYWKTHIQGAPHGKLEGKTVAVKDTIAVAGVPMMNGSRLMEGYVPEFDATVVTKVLDAGGLIAGKAACEDLSFSSGSFTTAKAPVLNPHSTAHSAGGSSCGSAVLVQVGEVDMAIGGDQGGSIRLPACWTGVVGLKPTFGLVPYTGAYPIDVSVDHLGPMARTVHDCALLLEVLAGYDDGLDPRQNPDVQVQKYTQALTGDLSGIKVGLLKEGFNHTQSEADVDCMVHEAAHTLSAAGATVTEVSVPLHTDAVHIWSPKCIIGAYQNMVQAAGLGAGFRGHHPTSMMEHMARAYRTHPNNLSVTMKATALYGEYMTQAYGNKFYNKASNLWRHLQAAYDSALQDCDVLVMPTIPFKATRLPSQEDHLTTLLDRALTSVGNTAPFNASGHPALNINTGFSEGLPVGMMIVGRYWDECTVLRVAHAYEGIRDAK